MPHIDDVRRYYDENTERFRRYGQGGGSIHRAVWGPAVRDREGAFHYVDEEIVAELARLGRAPHVLDLGCGIGASLAYVAGRVPEARATGITLSGVQAGYARETFEKGGLASRVRCLQGNFLELPVELEGAVDFAFAIEAFLHSPDAGKFFREAARVLKPGGRLLVCDDFLASADREPSAHERRWLDDFRRGWRVGSLIAPEEAQSLAEAAGLGFVRDVDLNGYLELRRPRDRMIDAVVSIGRWLPFDGEYWRMLVGGAALQRALAAGAIHYRIVVFEKG